MSMPTASPISATNAVAGTAFSLMMVGFLLAVLIAPLLWLAGLIAMSWEPADAADQSTYQPAAQVPLHPDTIPPDAQKHSDRYLDAQEGR